MKNEKKITKSREYEKLKENLKQRFISSAHIMFGRDLKDLPKNDIYKTVAAVGKQIISENWIQTNKAYQEREVKQVYYFSIEFLLGRLLRANLINLGIDEAFGEVLEELGYSLEEMYGEEMDIGLGNGGLGRLAACFIDSLAAHRLPGHGCCIRYQYGLFEQKIIRGNQVEIPDNWLKDGFAWEYRKPDKSINVKFNGNAYMKKQADGSLKLVHENAMTVMAVPYDVPIVGYHNKTVNTLRLWNAEVNRDFSDYGMLTHEQMKAKNDYRNFVESITQYLYPDDSTNDGRKMRLIQEYFLVSAGVQSIVRHFLKSGFNIREFDKKVAIHINDTHPALCVAELMRILVDEQNLEWNEAWTITRGVCAYTNHTILPEALERWSVGMFRELLPRIYMIIDEINRRHVEYIRARYPDNVEKLRAMSIIESGEVHMARLAIVGSHSVNGVARIHTDILKSTTLHDFYEYWPRMFNNKTNGITHRRWLMGANPELANLIDKTIGSRIWHRHPEQLDLFNEAVDNRKVLLELEKIKHLRKEGLAEYIKKHNNIEVSPDTIFDIQVKRIHSYKRQLMNILHIMWQYNKLKTDPSYNPPATTYFFGGKAAPGYYIAKETIRLILAVAKKVNNDASINGKLKVVFIENFGVSIGEIVYPAADVSEQISTASKEASGTGNMKFMMNGAITLGTLDGANVEIREAVGDDNIVIFGLKAGEVLRYYETGTYSAWQEYNDNINVRIVVDKLTDGTYGNFQSLRDYLISGNDEFFILKDFNAYIDGHNEIYARYSDKMSWLRSCAVNIANSARFSSDRILKEVECVYPTTIVAGFRRAFFMRKTECLGMILAGGQGSRLKALTKTVAKPAVPFGGKYRIIDFPLSNCANSGITKVGVLTQYKPFELHNYLGAGSAWDLDRIGGGVFILPPYAREKGADWYRGTADAIYQNLNFIDLTDPDYVLILSGDHIYTMDYSWMLESHKANNADVTIGVFEVPIEEAPRFGIMVTDKETGRITEFQEKPKEPKSTLASMGIYIFSKPFLKKYLEEDGVNENSSHDFGNDLIPKMLSDGARLFSYAFDGYWKDVGTYKKG